MQFLSRDKRDKQWQEHCNFLKIIKTAISFQVTTKIAFTFYFQSCQYNQTNI